MNQLPTAPAWNLDAIFAGGVEGEAFRDALAAYAETVHALHGRLGDLPDPTTDPDAFRALLLEDEALGERGSTLWTFAHCHWSADARSTAARMASGRVEALGAKRAEVGTRLQSALDALSDEAFEGLVSHPDLDAQAPMLRNARATRHLRLPGELQALWAELNPQSLMGWGTLYDLVSGQLSAEITLPGATEPTTLGPGQLNALLAHRDEPTRRAAHEAGQIMWDSAKDLCSTTLTHLTGTRMVRNRRCGVDELAATTARNRIQPATLEAMWSAADHAREALVAYLDRKARLIGKDRLDWWDPSAPLSPAEGTTVAWPAAVDAIERAFAGWDPEMAAFARHACEQGWVEAEDRSGKRQGGYCTRVTSLGESRIFMTWGNNQRTATTLAHELGHAWHNAALFGLPFSRRAIVSATAETASTFAEALYRDALLEGARDDATRIGFLDQELSAGVAFLMNIRARYLFERQLYALREDGPLAPDQLSEAMLAAQHEAYAGALASWDPLFWASKLHFHIAHFGFYNWPYTFGYLFSSAVYVRAKAEGAAFRPTYQALLEGTGYRQTEPLVQELLGEDMTQPAFWTRAVQPLLDKAQQFLDATADA